MNPKLLAGLLLLAAPAYADLTLTQVTEQENPMMPGKMTMTMVQKIKGKKMRVDAKMPARGMQGDSSCIIDGDSGEIAMMIPALKRVQRMSASAWKEQTEMFQRQALAAQQATGQKLEQPRIAATGRKAVINGQETEEYTAVTPTGQIDYWIAPALRRLVPTFLEIAKMTPSPLLSQFPDPATFPGLPMKMVITRTMPSAAGPLKFTSTMEITKISEEPIEDTEFSVPADYQEPPKPPR